MLFAVKVSVRVRLDTNDALERVSVFVFIFLEEARQEAEGVDKLAG